MPPLHKASLVEASSHSKKVLQLLNLRINRGLIDYLVQETAEAVGPILSRCTTSVDKSNRRSIGHSDFARFIEKLVRTADVKIPTLLVTLVYIRRSKSRLTAVDIITSERWGWALHRVFLGALIVAYKYTKDSHPKNLHWALATGLFVKRQIDQFEREFLGSLLHWKLAVSEANILDLHASIMVLYPSQVIHPSRRPIPSVETIFHQSDSNSEDSSPASSPALPTRFTSASRRPIPSVETTFHQSDSDSEGSSPASSPAPPTRFTSSASRRPNFKGRVKPMHISHARSASLASNSEDSSPESSPASSTKSSSPPWRSELKGKFPVKVIPKHTSQAHPVYRTSRSGQTVVPLPRPCPRYFAA